MKAILLLLIVSLKTISLFDMHLIYSKMTALDIQDKKAA